MPPDRKSSIKPELYYHISAYHPQLASFESKQIIIKEAIIIIMVESSSSSKTGGQPHLMVQDAKTVDPSKLTALTPEVVSC